MSMNDEKVRDAIAKGECFALVVSAIGILSALGVIVCAVLELV